VNDEKNPLVGVVVLNFRNCQDTIECVRSVLNSEYQGVRVYVVDNNSSDGSYEALVAEFGGSAPVVNVIASSTNGGFAKGNNQGIRQALRDGASYVWILNNDTVVDPQSVRMLVECWHRHQMVSRKVGPLGARVLYYNQPHLIQGVGGRFNLLTGSVGHIGEGLAENYPFDEARVLKETDYTMGVSMFVSSAYLVEVGLLCEDYFLYFEELDWSVRASRCGWSPGVCLDATVLHKEGATIGSSTRGIGRSELSDIEGQRSRFRFFSKYYPWMLPVAALLLLPVFWNRVRRGQVSRIGRMLKASLFGAMQR